MWFDATANFARLNSPDSIRHYLDKAARAGFTDVVVDVKPITGEVLYPSHHAPQMREWQGVIRPDSFDFLRTFIDESHARSLRVHASLNVFAAGHNFFDRGLVYSAHSEWQSILWTDSGLIPMTKMKKKYSAMTNPAHPEVRRHELAVLKELVTKYPTLDGVILDRVRYDGIEADFSDLSRREFEKYISARLKNFPRDIFAWRHDEAGKPARVEGKYFKRWIEWRASVIKSFFVEARRVVKKANPRISFGDYTGSWYPIYYEMGVNWASVSYDPSKQYQWATPTYKNTGYAELLDLYTSGNYYFEVTKEELISNNTNVATEAGTGGGKEYWYSVEGSCEIVNEVLAGAAPAYGGLYVQQYEGHPEQFAKAVEMCLRKSDGLMIFDLVHIVNFNWWEVVEKAIRAEAKGLEPGK
ncbi:MAG: family 10 glycosylhydrolase [Ignavibacteriae bacterium]|nr:family 10 glycosylhydrolase [Ignavibacteriota bacterium]